VLRATSISFEVNGIIIRADNGLLRNPCLHDERDGRQETFVDSRWCAGVALGGEQCRVAPTNLRNEIIVGSGELASRRPHNLGLDQAIRHDLDVISQSQDTQLYFTWKAWRPM
jgi:hypothetical protein